MCNAYVSGSLFHALKLAEVKPQPNFYTIQKLGFRVSNKIHFKQEAGDIRGAFQPGRKTASTWSGPKYSEPWHSLT